MGEPSTDITSDLYSTTAGIRGSDWSEDVPRVVQVHDHSVALIHYGFHGNNLHGDLYCGLTLKKGVSSVGAL